MPIVRPASEGNLWYCGVGWETSGHDLALASLLLLKVRTAVSPQKPGQPADFLCCDAAVTGRTYLSQAPHHGPHPGCGIMGAPRRTQQQFSEYQHFT